MIDRDKIHRGMDVLTSDDQQLGTVRELLEKVLFLDDVETGPKGKEPSVPLTWIVSTEGAVRLAKSLDQVRLEWNAGPGTSL